MSYTMPISKQCLEYKNQRICQYFKPHEKPNQKLCLYTVTHPYNRFYYCGVGDKIILAKELKDDHKTP